MDPDPDPGGPKIRGSGGSGFGSATLLKSKMRQPVSHLICCDGTQRLGRLMTHNHLPSRVLNTEQYEHPIQRLQRMRLLQVWNKGKKEGSKLVQDEEKSSKFHVVWSWTYGCTFKSIYSEIFGSCKFIQIFSKPGFRYGSGFCESGSRPQ